MWKNIITKKKIRSNVCHEINYSRRVYQISEDPLFIVKKLFNAMRYLETSFQLLLHKEIKEFKSSAHHLVEMKKLLEKKSMEEVYTYANQVYKLTKKWPKVAPLVVSRTTFVQGYVGERRIEKQEAPNWKDLSQGFVKTTS